MAVSTYTGNRTLRQVRCGARQGFSKVAKLAPVRPHLYCLQSYSLALHSSTHGEAAMVAHPDSSHSGARNGLLKSPGGAYHVFEQRKKRR